MKQRRVASLFIYLFTLVLALGCQNQKAVGTDHKGNPLFTVQGVMSLRGTTTAPSSIRLAVAWYKDVNQNSSPNSIVTQDIAYQGTFPLNYTFSFFSTPPADALSTYEEGGQTVKAAYGLLLAYEDLNGNGQLDSIPSGQGPIDRVWGSSSGDFYNGNPVADPIYVYFVDGTPLPSWTRVSAGFQLISSSRAILPINTQVPLPLDGTNELSLLVCEELMSMNGDVIESETPCKILPTGGFRIKGTVGLVDGYPVITIGITDGTNLLTNGQVEVNGETIPFDPQLKMHHLASAISFPTHLVFPGQENTVKVTMPGAATREFRVDLSEDFSLTAPAANTRVFAGSPLQVTWTQSQSASWYNTVAYSGLGNTVPVQTTAMSAQITNLSVDDYQIIHVDAYHPNFIARGLGFSWVLGSVRRSTLVDVIPVGTQLNVAGNLFREKNGGSTIDGVLFNTFDGINPLNSASVSVNGTSVGYDATVSGFYKYGPNLVTSNGTSELRVSAPGRPDFVALLELPGDFSQTNQNPTVSKSAPIVISWSPSQATDSYEFGVYDLNNQPLIGLSVDASTTSFEIPPLRTEGTYYLTVTAVKAVNRHLGGRLLDVVMLNVTP